MLPIVITSTEVASVVTTMKISSLTRSPAVRLSRTFIAATPPLRGPSGRRAAGRGRGRPAALTPRTGPSSDRSRSVSSVVPASVRKNWFGTTREVPLPVGSSTPSLKSGWWRTGLFWFHGGFGRCRQFGPRSSPKRGLSSGVVRARLVGQRLQDDVQREAAERLGLELAGVDDAAGQAGELGGVLREHPQLLVADVARAGSGCRRSRRGSRARCRRTLATSSKSAFSLSSRSSRVPVVVTVLSRISAICGITAA